MDAHRDDSRRRLAVLCLASAAWAFSFGLGAPLAALWLRDAGRSHGLAGLNTAAYYLGVALAAPLVPVLMRRGARRCMAAGMIADGLTVALFPWVHGEAAWFLLRLLGGAATALCLIPLETLVNRNAPPHRRAGDFGVYAFCVALGVGLGPVAGVPLYPHAPRLAFALGGAVAVAGTLLLARLPAGAVHAEEMARGGLPLGDHLLSFGTAWAQGFLEGGTLTFLTGYLLGLGYTEAGAGGLLGAMFLGVVLAQVPVAGVADRLGRRRVLLGCQAVVLAGLVTLPLLTGPAALSAALFLVGACSAATYPLGLALLGERVPVEGLARANAWYLACNCAGSLSGPITVGWAMDLAGGRALFGVGAAAVTIAVLPAAFARRQRAADAVAVRRAA